MNERVWDWVWPESCEGVLTIGSHEPTRQNPDDPEGKPIPACPPRRIYFSQGHFRTDEVEVSRAVAKRVEGMEHGPHLQSGPDMTPVPDIAPKWRTSPGMAWADSEAVCGIFNVPTDEKNEQ